MSWTNYVLGLLLAIVPLSVGFALLYFVIRWYRRRTGNWLLRISLSFAFLVSLPLFLIGGFFTRTMALAPTPGQASARVATVLHCNPADVTKIELRPYSFSGPTLLSGTTSVLFPKQPMTITEAEQIEQICTELASALPASSRDTSFPNHPNKTWKCYFTISIQNATYHCDVTKTSNEVALIDLFYDMTDKERLHLGTFQTQKLAAILEDYSNYSKK